MEFCFTFDGHLSNSDSLSNSYLLYDIETVNEKVIIFDQDDIQVASTIPFDFNEHPFLSDNEPTPLRVTIINASTLSKRIKLRDMGIPWLIDKTYGEVGYYYHIRPKQSVTLKTAFNTATGIKSWFFEESLSFYQDAD